MIRLQCARRSSASPFLRRTGKRYLPLGHADLGGGDLLSPASACNSWSVARRSSDCALFEDASVRKVGHDLKADVIILRTHGIELKGLAFDSMLASYLLDATSTGPSAGRHLARALGYKA